MKNKLLKLSTLFILYVTAVYTAIVVATTDVVFVEKHYLALLILVVATIAFFIKSALGSIITLMALIVGIFGNAAITPYQLNVGIGSLKMSLPFIIILIYFLIINIKEIPAWREYAFKEEKNDNGAN